MTEPLLAIDDLHAWYGESHVLHGMALEVHEGELITLLGRNGAGRTTTLKSVLGLVGRREGSIRIGGQEVIRAPTHRIAHIGQLGYCPEERGIYSRLSVEENLRLPPALSEQTMSVERIYEMFPQLAERRRSMGTQLSGGEQQMLAIGRILRTGARLLLLDEITEGLAPVIVGALGETIRQLKSEGLTIVLVEQNFHFAEPLADRHYIIEHGQVVETIRADEADSKRERINQLLSV